MKTVLLYHKFKFPVTIVIEFTDANITQIQLFYDLTLHLPTDRTHFNVITKQ